jgi:hypothetical protein
VSQGAATAEEGRAAIKELRMRVSARHATEVQAEDGSSPYEITVTFMWRGKKVTFKGAHGTLPGAAVAMNLDSSQRAL